MRLPDWARTSSRNPWSASQAAGCWPADRALRAVPTLAPRLLPGPTPVTAARRSASWAGAPRTVTWNVPAVIAPSASTAEQSTEVVPTGNVVPEAGVQVMPTVVSPSVAVASYTTGAPDGVVA